MGVRHKNKYQTRGLKKNHVFQDSGYLCVRIVVYSKCTDWLGQVHQRGTTQSQNPKPGRTQYAEIQVWHYLHKSGLRILALRGNDTGNGNEKYKQSN